MILGVAGTFMAGLARLARALDHEIIGVDQQIYPPMSIQLAADGLQLHHGYDQQLLDTKPDLVIIGNALSRGNPLVEAVLSARIRYCSGPQWLFDQVLRHRQVCAVSGTHGKTTTASMLAWILTESELNPGFLIGGVPGNFDGSAVLGSGRYFVIEADEYDSAFFDKRSKFVHYQPQQLIINNLEFDHADIFSDLSDIQRQFHHLIRTIPAVGTIIYPDNQPAIEQLLAMGCWSKTIGFGGAKSKWRSELLSDDGRYWRLVGPEQQTAEITWSLIGAHNVANGLAASIAAYQCGVSVDDCAQVLAEFRPPARRMEVFVQQPQLTAYNDFAHHPSAIATTLAGLRAHIGQQATLVCVLQCRSYTMRSGAHTLTRLADALALADAVQILDPQQPDWSIAPLVDLVKSPCQIHQSIDGILAALAPMISHATTARPVHIVFMSNGDFDGIYQRFAEQQAT